MPSTERPWEEKYAAANIVSGWEEEVSFLKQAYDLAVAHIATLETERATLREQLHPTKEGPLSGDPKGLA